MPKSEIALFWFRRDLRLDDNAALYYALKSNYKVLPIFIFDTEILQKLSNTKDARVQFIYNQVALLKNELNDLGSDLKVFYGKPLSIFEKLYNEYTVKILFANHDYEPYAIQRDAKIAAFLKQKNVAFKSYKDQSIFEKNEIVKDDGKAYTIFTPYMKKWKERISDFYLKAYPNQAYFSNFYKVSKSPLLQLTDIGFEKSDIEFPENKVDSNVLKKYHEQRDFPGINGTSRLSVHLRFGTVSIRSLAKLGFELNEKWLNELIWRDFYMMILYHFPHVVNNAFKPAYDAITWRNNEKEFEAWCQGNTGYPIVDSGMRELNATGFMHNRVRMIVASFLTKHLLVDWRWGEAYFAEKLLDFELSSNNGGWQWAAGSGCDAAPYFRVFNPYLQTLKFDPKGVYIRKWVPEFDSLSYPQAIVDHKFARERVLKVYKNALDTNATS
jgi:deoxyribodipyrimidine photo-lyase